MWPRAGATSEVSKWVEEFSVLSPEFAKLWEDTDVRTYGEGVKRLRHPDLGLIELEYPAFAVDRRPDLGMIVYSPMAKADADCVRSLVNSLRPAI